MWLLLLLFTPHVLSANLCSKSIPRPPRIPCLWIASISTLHCQSRNLVALPASPKDVPSLLVRSLILRNNSLTTLPCLSFSAWPNLEFVDVSQNRLAWIDRHVLYGSSVKSLNLSYNLLQSATIEKVILRNYPTLDLSHNQIVGNLDLQRMKKVRAKLWPNPVICACPNQPLLLWIAREEKLSSKELLRRCLRGNRTYSDFLQDKSCLNTKQFRLFVTTTGIAIGILIIVVVTYAWKKRQHDHYMRKPSTILFKREPTFFSLRAMSARNSIASRCFVLYEQIAGFGRSPRPSLKSAGSKRSHIHASTPGLSVTSSAPQSPRPSVKSLGCLSLKRTPPSPRPSIKSAEPRLYTGYSSSDSME